MNYYILSLYGKIYILYFQGELPMSRKMTKSILSRDEITLFKHSEELKNTDLYGNLYDILFKINKIKAISIDELIDLGLMIRGL